ncbi:MAG: hypothetical protein B7Z81_04000 [Acidocella sp. 20-61-6]|nr:MAG: hypothetical protein B7Z81_04000 [Acidocella sp. 20-61-6]
MRRLLWTSLLSILLYLTAFGALVDRPLSLGLVQLELAQKTTRLAAMPSPKLIILAGSNGPYSHSCVVLGAMLNLPCENAGIAVGIGLDDIFAHYASLLRPGDVVYMPMEIEQYAATWAQYRAGVDGGFLLRHDPEILRQLPAGRIFGAVFCCNLADLLESLAEMPMARFGGINPGRLLAAEYNVQGDRIDNALVNADTALLNHQPRVLPDGTTITDGYGAALIARFVARETSRKIIVIGGLPTDFTTVVLTRTQIRAVASIYTTHGGGFMTLPNDSLYPATDFFNSEDHLARPCQYLHTMAVANALAALLHRPVVPPGNRVVRFAQTCPSTLAGR